MQQHIDRDYAAGETVHWGIALRETGAVVGTCGYYRGFAGGAGELGCVLLPGAQGQGYMTEALHLAIAFGRQEMGLNRIWAVTTVDNAPAIRLLKRLGFVEGADPKGDEVEYMLPG
jgi:ribosomal-protein-alanine N-acetyltransferase